jgi:LPXTG-site transpeptidase (sortase) family protein
MSVSMESSTDDRDATPTDLQRPADDATEVAGAPRGPMLRSLLRGALMALALIGSVLLVYGTIVSTLIHDQRQAHLGSEAKSPASTLSFGDASLTLQIPDIGTNLTVIEGVTVDHLRGGPAREPTGALPGDAGVMLVYGHRDAYGAPFERVERLVAGNAIYTQARNGPAIKYQVTEVLRHTTISKWKPPDDTKDLSYMVLVTSEGGWFERDQLVVIAKALPVSQSPARIADLTTGEMNGRAWMAHLALALLALLACIGAWRFLEGRAGRGVRLATILAAAALGIVSLLMALDSLLPLVR